MKLTNDESTLSIDSVLEQINIRLAMRYLKDKPDTCGIDGVKISALQDYLHLNGEK